MYIEESEKVYVWTAIYNEANRLREELRTLTLDKDFYYVAKKYTQLMDICIRYKNDREFIK